MCDEAVACGKDVLSAQDIKECVENKTKTNIFVVQETDVKEIQNSIPPLKTVPETSKTHQVIWSKLNPDQLFFRYASCTECLLKTKCTHFSLKHVQTYPSFVSSSNSIEIGTGIETDYFMTLENSYEIGDWVVVIYDKIWYPGIIIALKNDMLVTNFMSKSGITFKWPKKKDVQNVLKSQVLLKIKEPTDIDGKKKKFQFTETDFNMINDAADNCVIYE